MSEPQSVRGVIVARMPFGNTSLIVRCLSREAGRLTFMAKGANRPKSPFAGALDLFYLNDFLFQPSRSGEMHTLREAKIVEPNLGLRRSYTNMIAIQYFAALIEAMTESGTPIPGEYDLFTKALGYLCEKEATWTVVERYERRILTLAGLGHGEQDLPHAFRTLHHTVPSLREDLLKMLVRGESKVADPSTGSG